MDTSAILDLANQVVKLKMFPYFDAAHAIMACLAVRDDLGSDGTLFSRKHPLACWLSSMMAIFAGSIVSALLLGEPVMGVFNSGDQLLLATGVWWVIFYSPFDVGCVLAKFLPLKIVISTMKEVQRCKKIHDGVLHAAKIYPNGYVAMAVIGTLKGNGAGFLRLFERLVRGVWAPNAQEILNLSFQSKLSFLAAVVFAVDHKTQLISAPHALVHLGVVMFFVYFKLSSLLLGIHDPIAPLENLFSLLFLGGIWDALSGASGTSAPTPAPAAKSSQPKSGGKKQPAPTGGASGKPQQKGDGPPSPPPSPKKEAAVPSSPEKEKAKKDKKGKNKKD